MKRDTPEYIRGLAKDLRLKQTAAEELLWDYLRGNKINGCKFRRQYPVGRYIADFYCIKNRLLIELDGQIHDQPLRKEYDLIRQTALENRDIKVLRFSNGEIFSDIHRVIKRISNELTPLPSLGEGRG